MRTPRSLTACWPGILFVALAAAAAGAGPGGAAQGRPRDLPLGQVALQNGTGDGTANLVVDAYGFFNDLVYDPLGPIGPATTTSLSIVWFSGAGAAGMGGRGTFLDAADQGTLAFTSATDTRAVSDWQKNGMAFHLEQELLPPTRDGSIFRQAYTVTNDTGAATSFDMIRFLDADLDYDLSPLDLGGVGSRGQVVYEFDATDSAAQPVTTIAIDLNGAANLGYRVAQDFLSGAIEDQGRAVLDNTVVNDANGDGITDTPADLSVMLGQTFSVAAGQSVTFVTNTVLGTREQVNAPKSSVQGNGTLATGGTFKVNASVRPNGKVSGSVQAKTSALRGRSASLTSVAVQGHTAVLSGTLRIGSQPAPFEAMAVDAARPGKPGDSFRIFVQDQGRETVVGGSIASKNGKSRGGVTVHAGR